MDLPGIIEAAIKEDLPEGDLTTDSLGIKEKLGRAKLVAKQDLVLSGSKAFTETLLRFDSEIQIKWHFSDGDQVLAGQNLAAITGNLINLIKAERTALNFIGHLSGIATTTNTFVREIAGHKTKILDTRKTTPGWRKLEKEAVQHGGGVNHRLNLSDAVMIKDNHISLAGGLKNAVEKVRKHTDKPITVEAANLEQIKAAVELNVSRILLDNLSDEDLSEAVKLIPVTIETEASGNMKLDRVRRVAECGVNFISVGALTHSAPCADISLLIENLKGVGGERN